MNGLTPQDIIIFVSLRGTSKTIFAERKNMSQVIWRMNNMSVFASEIKRLESAGMVRVEKGIVAYYTEAGLDYKRLLANL